MADDPYRRLRRALASRDGVKLDRAVENLSEQEAQVVRLRFGMAGSRPRTLEETGREIGATQKTVRELEARALGKLCQESASTSAQT